MLIYTQNVNLLNHHLLILKRNDISEGTFQF